MKKLDLDTMIIEDEVKTSNEPVVEKQTQSLLCFLRIHRRTRWSKPFLRSTITGFSFNGGEFKEDRSFQIRECLGCGMREERTLSND